MRWILAFHIIAVVAWFAGLFYLPRLFVYHAQSHDKISLDRFKVMEYKLFWYIMTPAGLLASLFGLALWLPYYDFYATKNWMHAKLILVLLLWSYHIYCGYLLKRFALDKNRYSQKFYRFFNEFPTLILIAVVILVVVKP